MAEKLLSLLRTISEYIAESKNGAEALSGIVSILAKKLKADVCSIYEYDTATDYLLLTATHGLNPKTIGRTKIKPGEGFAGQAFNQRSIINIADSTKNSHNKVIENTSEKDYKSLLGIPLISVGKCLGILMLQKKSAGKFPDIVVEMARSLGPQLANLILSAKMLQGLSGQEIPTISEAVPSQTMSLSGTVVNNGIASGKIFKLKPRDLLSEAEHTIHDDAEAELQVFEKALRLAKINTLELETKALSMISEADASIFDSHLLFLEDKDVLDAIKHEIIEEKHQLEFSIALVYKQYEKRFMRLKDPVFRERLLDFKDVMLRLLEAAVFIRSNREQQDEVKTHDGKWIVVADELLPSNLMRLPIDNLCGIVCEKGGITSHVAILAKAFTIPALLGVRDVMKQTNNYDEALLDCYNGKLFVNPDENTKTEFKRLIRAERHVEPEEAYPALTTDGVRITMMANVALICEINQIKQFGAEGIGLYRTEFLFMVRDHAPSEEIQYEVFSQFMNECDGEITLRLLDAGSDKQLSCLNIPVEENPALGLRGVRLLMRFPELLHSHLRAVLRSGIDGKLKILLPMVSTVNELLLIKTKIAETEAALRKENIPHCRNFQIGIMLEVPSLVFGLEKIISHVDFVSLGTNDLLQFVFARDRMDDEMGKDIACFDPFFCDMLSNVGAVTKKMGKTFNICGEMAGTPLAIPLLIGAGVDTLSMSPHLIPGIRKIITCLSQSECRDLLHQAVSFNNAAQVMEILVKLFVDKKISDLLNQNVIGA